MGIKVTIKSRVKETMQEIRKAQRRKMVKITTYGRKQVLNYMTGTKTGRIYRVPGTKKVYTASAPGESPAIRTSQLFNSIAQEVIETREGYEGIIGTPLDYGVYLEFGTSRMLPRPWLGPPLQIAQKEFKRILSEKWL